MHMLSTEIHLRKSRAALEVGIFPLVTRGFSAAPSLRIPSFHEAPLLVLFTFIGDISLAQILGVH